MFVLLFFSFVCVLGYLLADEVPSRFLPPPAGRSGRPKQWIIPRRTGVKKMLRHPSERSAGTAPRSRFLTTLLKKEMLQIAK